MRRISQSSLSLEGETGAEFDIEDDNTDYQIGLALEISESLRTYLSYATGHKSAGASLQNVTVPAGFENYDAEQTETLELGLEGARLG